MTLAAVAPMSTSSTDSTPTTFALNSTDTTSSTGGSLVNDKIHVINQSLTEGIKNDGIIEAHDAENIQYNSTFTIDDSVHSGDTMTVNYDKNTIPSDLTTNYSLPNLIDNSGEVIANGSYDESQKQITYTFTDYVDKYENVIANLSLTSYIDKEQVPNRDTQLHLIYKTADSAIEKMLQ